MLDLLCPPGGHSRLTCADERENRGNRRVLIGPIVRMLQVFLKLCGVTADKYVEAILSCTIVHVTLRTHRLLSQAAKKSQMDQLARSLAD